MNNPRTLDVFFSYTELCHNIFFFCNSYKLKIPVVYTRTGMPVGYTRLELLISLKLTLSLEPYAGIF